MRMFRPLRIEFPYATDVPSLAIDVRAHAE